MESLAFTHVALAYDDPNPAPQLRSFAEIEAIVTNSAVGVLALGVALSVISTADHALALVMRGDSGAEVVYLQNQLKDAGYFPLDVASTGYFGGITQSAVMNFQYDMGLAVDGVAGNQTYAALEGSPGIGTGSHMVTANALNVRAGAGTSFRVVDVVYYSQAVSVDYFDHLGWAKLSSGGWVSGDYLAQL